MERAPKLSRGEAWSGTHARSRASWRRAAGGAQGLSPATSRSSASEEAVSPAKYTEAKQ